MESGQIWRQYIIAAIGSMLIGVGGYTSGWTAPINVKLADPEQSPLPDIITIDQEAWIGSLLNIGVIFGPFIGGFSASILGRKWGILSCAIPFYLCWVLLTVATNISFLYAGRVFGGLGIGMAFSILPMYCNEIATDAARGALGSYLQLFISVGVVIVYSIAPYVTYWVTAYIALSLLTIFCIVFSFMPESPIYCLIKNDREAAAASLAMIRGKSHDGIEDELNKMANDVANSNKKTAAFIDILRGNNFKAFSISCALMFFQQMSGSSAVVFYSTNIFIAAGSNLEPAIASIVIASVQAGASIGTPFLANVLKRRTLLMLSSCGSAISLGLLGMYFLLDDLGSPLAHTLNFLPLLCLVVYFISFCSGIGPLPWAIMSEMLPIEVKTRAASIIAAFCGLMAFLVTRFFGPIGNAAGMVAVFWIFAACCLASFFFALFVVPETKDKSFQEIQDILSGEKSKKLEKQPTLY